MFLNKKYVIPAILVMSQTQAVAEMASEESVSNRTAIDMISQFLATPMVSQKGIYFCQVAIASQSEDGIVVDVKIKNVFGNFEVQVPFSASDKKFSKFSSNGLLSISMDHSERILINGEIRLHEISFIVNKGQRSVAIHWGKDSIEVCRAK